MRRRDALHSLALSSAWVGMPASAGAQSTRPLPLPQESMHRSDPETYWLRIRKEQFYLPDWRVFLNNGSLGVAPRPVVKAMIDFEEQGDGRITDEYPRWGYETLDEMRTEMASFMGCDKDELAFVHNATEAMSTIAAGIDLQSGDEVLTTDQEHPSGKAPWELKAARYGITIRRVAIPLPPESPEQLTHLLISAIGPRTKVLSFSGILTTTGLILPVKEICRAARAKGVITVVDGAHMTGQIPTNLHEMECDYWAGSPHKWLFAPAGSGLLYGRREMLDRLWPTIVTGGWDEKETGAARFMKVGTNNRAIFEGMMAGLRFHRQIGPQRIYARMQQLSEQAIARAKRSPHMTLLTPEDPRMYSSLVTVKFKTDQLQPLAKALGRKRIWIWSSQQVRLSHHIHTRPQDIDLYFDTVEEVMGRS
jgi:isopenicillin-N epimerase